MSAYIEVFVKGDCRAYVDAASIMGVIMHPSTDGNAVATSKEPMTLIMRSGDTLSNVYGMSANQLLLYSAAIRTIVKEKDHLVKVAYLDSHDKLMADLANLMGGGGEDDG